MLQDLIFVIPIPRQNTLESF